MRRSKRRGRSITSFWCLIRRAAACLQQIAFKRRGPPTAFHVSFCRPFCAPVEKGVCLSQPGTGNNFQEDFATVVYRGKHPRLPHFREIFCIIANSEGWFLSPPTRIHRDGEKKAPHKALRSASPCWLR